VKMINFKLFNILIISSAFFVNGCNKEDSDIVENTDNVVTIDMLTPAYYVSGTDFSFINKVDQFIGFVQQERFHHPLENESGQVPAFTIPSIGVFGAGKGPNGTAQHHPAIDLHVGDSEIDVNIYAAHSGYVTTVKDADKYRHYVSISKDITDDMGLLIGKLVTLYAHIDLDLDEADLMLMDGQYVNKGDIISSNLYSETVGGPHLHFEIRYYRADDTGDETFYGFLNPDSPELTEPSAGNWIYGVWDPNVGVGFGNPISHGL